MKRFRKPILKDGELRVYYGKLPHDEPDVVFEWRGDSSMMRDTRLLYSVLACPKPDLFAKPLFSKMEPSLLQELEARGYDISTIKFSIQKKITAPTGKAGGGGNG